VIRLSRLPTLKSAAWRHGDAATIGIKRADVDKLHAGRAADALQQITDQRGE
jgi:hypothetical protein